MILLVDDDRTTLVAVKSALESEGLEVVTANNGAEALEILADKQPDLIISDVDMPEMDGFQFHAAAAELFDGEPPTFIFLSSGSETDQVVRALDGGADDYLLKPVEPVVLKAKVRALLRRTARQTGATFRGDLSRLPFVNVMKFCESKGLTGQLHITGAELDVRLTYQAGMLSNADDDAFGAVLSQLFDLTEGSFTISSQPVVYREIAAAAAEPKEPEEDEESLQKPMGQLSGVRAGNQLFQIQTEMASYPDPQLSTVVILDGRTVLTRTTPIEGSPGRDEIEKQIKDQHRSVEEEVQAKIASKSAPEPEPAADEPKEDAVNRLFDEGYTYYRDGNYERAIEAWEEASRLDPDNRTLEINIRTARSKLST